MRTSSTVLFRCDARESGGLGHFTRCVALIQALQRAGHPRAHLSGRLESPLAMAMLEGVDVTVHPPEDSTDGVIRLAGAVGASLVHVDDYGSWAGLREGGRVVGAVTSTATDSRFGRRDADVIVDGSPTALHAYDPLYGGADVALGPQYLALRDIFRASRGPHPASSAGECRVLIMMGGTDARGVGASIASAIHALPEVSRTGLVASQQRFDAMRMPGGVVRVEPAPNIRAVVSGWDLVVTAAGTTVWELCALGVPMALVGVAENQRDYYSALVDSGAAVGLGFVPEDGRLDTLDFSRIEQLARVGPREAPMLVDGQGAARVVEVWEAVLRDRSPSTGIRMIAAERRHSGRLFGWRDHPSTRAVSRSTDPITWSDHVKWLDSTLSREDRLLLVAYYRGDAIGTVRFDERVAGQWEASITLAPAHRGRGFGLPVLRAGIRSLVEAKSAREITATIAENNAASQSVFRSAGFSPGPDAGWQLWSWRSPR